ncbi:MAG: hypothetical protein DCF21_10480 [Leptolyngbya sp.]|nr:MAG: hypothetical protein DCF21_10480 [Leptolyngbya sp.]
MALGALIIKERLGTSDAETVEQIRENPYLQYFLGLHEYSDQAPFDASMLSHFRQRLSLELVNQVNARIVEAALAAAQRTPAAQNEATTAEGWVVCPTSSPGRGGIRTGAVALEGFRRSG